MAQINLSGSINVPGSVSILGAYNVIFASDANHTMSATEFSNNFLQITSSVSLTTTRNLIAPINYGQQYIVQNNTSGGQSIQIIGSSGSGVTIANGAFALVVCDNTNYDLIASTSNNFIAGGDLSGSATSQEVIGLLNHTLPSLSDGYLNWTGSAWALSNLSSLPPSGAAGGDLSGTYPNPNVINIHGASVPIAGSLTIGNVLQVSGSSALTYAPVNLAGGANYVTGTIPVANLPSMGGDVTGTITANYVGQRKIFLLGGM